MLSKTLLLVSLYYFHIPSSADEVIWLPNKSINLPTNFEDGKLPCTGQNIIFPETVEEGILVSDLSINGLILPNDGEIILDEGNVVFGRDPDDNCTRIGDTRYKDDYEGSWDSPDVWSSSRFNKATPDAEKVPCYYDSVVFPKTGQFAVKLPDRVQAVQSISIAGAWLSKPDDIENFITYHTNTQYQQQFILSAPGMIKSSARLRSIERCESTLHGCPCQEYALDINCKQKYCAPPKCFHPIKPEGHCCLICGASLVINITDKFDIKSFKQLVQQVVESYGIDKFDYHVGLLPHQYKKESERAQVIVMDKGEYKGVCNVVITDINHMISNDWAKGNVLFYSGNPSSESGQAAKIVVSVFFLVVIAMGATFGYYYKSSLLGMRDLRGGMPRGMLSRLQRRTESVMSLARRDSTVSTATTTGTAFRNPMYSSTRQRVQVVAAVNEE